MIIFTTFYGDPFVRFRDTLLKSTNTNLMVALEEKSGAPWCLYQIFMWISWFSSEILLCLEGTIQTDRLASQSPEPCCLCGNKMKLYPCDLFLMINVFSRNESAQGWMPQTGWGSQRDWETDLRFSVGFGLFLTIREIENNTRIMLWIVSLKIIHHTSLCL